MSIVKPCELLQIHRSGVYYKPKEESCLNLELMRLMDEHYLYHPFKGANRMHTWLTMDNGYKVSMDGKGRAIDNAFIERLWRSVKYEKLYLYPPQDGIELYQSLAEYFSYYNHERRYSGINHQIPDQQVKKAA